MLQYSDSDFFEFQKYDLMKKIVLAIENNIKMNRICMTIKSCRCGQSAIELNQAD